MVRSTDSFRCIAFWKRKLKYRTVSSTSFGVPTVVDAATIVHDSMAELLEALEEDEQKEFLEEMISPKLYTMFVTPKDG